MSELAGRDDTTIGQAFLAAKLAAAAAGLSEDVATFHLFGDPAMPLRAISPAPTPPAVTPTAQAPVPTPVPSVAPPVTPEILPTVQTVTPVPPPRPLPNPAFFLYLPSISIGEEP
jgi:hypothetical protein